MTERSLTEVQFGNLTSNSFHPSPAAWEDQVFYFLLVDRFSDGREQGYRDNDGDTVSTGAAKPFREADLGNAIGTEDDAARWREAGAHWCGGTLKGLESKIGYLSRLGAGAIWISPVLKQVSFQDTYHGYGVQNFLDVDPHFGNREDLRSLVRTAHAHGIYVILDIILNHTGNVFSYDPDRYWTTDQNGRRYLDPRWDGNPYTVAGFNDETGRPTFPFGPINPASDPSAWPNGAVWPDELQKTGTFTAKGRISNWDYDPEFREGDFLDLKDVHHGSGSPDDYQPSPALRALCNVYKFWIAYADLDGFRVDTVKHMDLGATRFFASVIHEFAQKLGKENFYLIGEITGGRERAYDTLEATGLDAALGIDDIPDRIEGLVKGDRNPAEYFDLFRNSLLLQKGSHVWFRNKVVTIIDDHDQIRKGNNKARFCAGGTPASLALAALALNATTLGIPCVYYGSEQAFDGQGDNDRYIREAMFGGPFGAFRSRERHFFSEESYIYRELTKVLKLRRERIALRRGRQYLREISGNGVDYGLPHMMDGRVRSIIAWSRLFDSEEILLAINTDATETKTAWVVVDAELHVDGGVLGCLYSSDAGQIGRTTAVTTRGDGAMVVSLTLPPAGFAAWV